MTKNEFLLSLREALCSLPEDEIDERVAFYSEMIDEGIDDGLSEEEAVASIGGTDGIAAHILSERVRDSAKPETPATPKRRLSAGETTLLVLGSPLWIAIALALFSVAVSVVAALWSVIVSLWATGAALVGVALGGIFGGICILHASAPSGLALIGMGIACVGLSILLFCGSRAATRGVYALTKKTVLGSIALFRKKEALCK